MSRRLPQCQMPSFYHSWLSATYWIGFDYWEAMLGLAKMRMLKYRRADTKQNTIAALVTLMSGVNLR